MGVKSVLLTVAGFIALAFGAIGLLLPILPTTPFVLLATGCFAGNSPKIYRYLANTKSFGGFIRHYQSKAGVSKREKRNALVFLWCGLSISALFVHQPVVWGVLLVVGLAVTAHVLLIKTKAE